MVRRPSVSEKDDPGAVSVVCMIGGGWYVHHSGKMDMESIYSATVRLSVVGEACSSAAMGWRAAGWQVSGGEYTGPEDTRPTEEDAGSHGRCGRRKCDDEGDEPLRLVAVVVGPVDFGEDGKAAEEPPPLVPGYDGEGTGSGRRRPRLRSCRPPLGAPAGAAGLCWIVLDGVTGLFVLHLGLLIAVVISFPRWRIRPLARRW